MNIKRIQRKRQRRATRVRAALASKSKRLRISVFRSLKHIYAQIIDDNAQHTIVASSSKMLNLDSSAKLDKTSVAKAVGVDLAQKAIQANITEVCFDRGSYLYHGRVRSLAEGLKEGGLKL